MTDVLIPGPRAGSEEPSGPPGRFYTSIDAFRTWRHRDYRRRALVREEFYRNANDVRLAELEHLVAQQLAELNRRQDFMRAHDSWHEYLMTTGREPFIREAEEHR